MPTAKIKPGTAYPIESKELKRLMIVLGLNLIEKLIIKAKTAVTNPEIIAREIELNEVWINFLLIKDDWLSNAQYISSVIGKINPIKRGIKHIKKA